MPIHIKPIEDLPNVLVSIASEPFDPALDAAAAMQQFGRYLQEWEGKIYLISDIRQINPSFSDIMIGMAETAARPDSPVRNDRMVTITVAEGDLLRNMVTWFKQEQYGGMDIPLFGSLEEATEYVKSLKEQASS